nr:hypothetical protein [Halorubellus sp. JP-L1]
MVADSDGDGLDDGAERDAGTNPLVADSDGDGLGDGREVHDLGTDPLATDTDDDGLADGREVESTGTDPLVVDTDGDGLGDDREVTAIGSDPTEADTDGDGLRDGREVRDLETDPTEADTDGDGLADGREVEVVGTDPTVADTDGDGLDDGVEAAETGPLAAADPLARDVFVELDYMRGERPDPDAVALVVDRFANAPIENPDGSTGVALHVVVDDAIPREPTTSEFDSVRLRLSHFDNTARGYHHAMVVADARATGESVAGFATTGHVVLQTHGDDGDAYTTRGQAHVLMHELGHSLGLSATRYAGIDSHAVPYDDYESTMNYNSPWEAVTYSSSGAFDDWAYLDKHMYAPPAWRLPTARNASATTSASANESTSTASSVRASPNSPTDASAITPSFRLGQDTLRTPFPVRLHRGQKC